MPITENSLIRFKNEINQTAQNLDVIEQRIICSAISKITSNEAISDDKLYKVSAEDLQKLGSLPNNAYEQLEKCAETLFKRYIGVRFLDDNGNEHIIKIHWIQRLQYTKGSGEIQIRFTKDILPFLSELKEQFTTIHLMDISGLTSSYAVQLYMKVMQFQETRKAIFSVEDLRFCFSLGKKYPRYADFKRIVLATAIRQINDGKYTKFTLSLNEKKRGRKVDKLIFTLTPKNPQMLTEPVDPSTVIEEIQDMDKIDKFSGLSIREATLSPNQIAMFADRLAGDNRAFAKESVKIQSIWLRDAELKKFASQKGETKQAYVARLSEELQKPEFVMKIAHFLRMVGFQDFA